MACISADLRKHPRFGISGKTSAHAADHAVSESEIASAILTHQEENMHFEQPKQPVSQ
jgi:hypothetical protein